MFVVIIHDLHFQSQQFIMTFLQSMSVGAVVGAGLCALSQARTILTKTLAYTELLKVK